MNQRLLLLFALVVAPYLVSGAFAKDKAKDAQTPVTEQTHKLDPMEVKTNPFAHWGISLQYFGSPLIHLGAPAKHMYVTMVAAGSPAHKAGVQLGDEVLAVDGVPVTELWTRDLKKHFYNTERGEKVQLQLKNVATRKQRTVELDVKSNKTWIREEAFEGDYWGVRCSGPKSLQVSVRTYFDSERIAGFRTVEVKSRKKKKDPNEPVKTKQVPIRVHRRVTVIEWTKKHLVLIERENRVVEIIEAEKAPESDDVVGRLAGEGSTLMLRADGTYELDVVLPKNEPVKTSISGAEAKDEDRVGDANHAMRGTDGHTPAVAAWNRSVEPFCIAGNLYYVGASGVASYLIATPDGHILIDSGFAETVTHIEANMKKLGFRLEDIRVLLISHAHYDHVGGMAELKFRTKARLLVNPAERDLLARGGKGDFAFGDKYPFAPELPDGELRDGEVVKLGGVELTAHFTPGHTKGSTSWTTTVRVNEREYRVVIAASMTAPEYKLIGNVEYPTILNDYRTSFEKLRALPCDIFLSSHGWDFGLSNKMDARAKTPNANPFVDPEGYHRFLDKSETNLKKQIEKQNKVQTAP
ncbi:MAG: subclass B3 metallo-beta-lactamase [Nibricoccus sp.]